MDDAGAEAALTGFSRVLNRIETQKRLSLTCDHGREMVAHQRLTQATRVQGPFTQDQLDAIAWQLNTRPRKSMDYRCPVTNNSLIFRKASCNSQI